MGDGVWHVIHTSEIMEMLNKVHEGGDPDFVYLEHYANCEHHENVEGDGDGT